MLGSNRAFCAALAVAFVTPGVALAQGQASAAPALAPATVPIAPVFAPPSLASALVVGGPQQSLRVGTELPLRLLAELTTNGKTLKLGDRFDLETVESVSVGGQVVIPVGSRAVGEVTRVRNKGMWGKSGGIDARVMYVTANGRNIRVSGNMTDKGVTGTAGVIGAVAFIPVAGFFLTGTSATIAAGTIVRGYIDEDVPVAFAAGSAPVPMVVDASVAPIAAALAAPGAKLTTPVTPNDGTKR